MTTKLGGVASAGRLALRASLHEQEPLGATGADVGVGDRRVHEVRRDAIAAVDNDPATVTTYAAWAVAAFDDKVDPKRVGAAVAELVKLYQSLTVATAAELAKLIAAGKVTPADAAAALAKLHSDVAAGRARTDAVMDASAPK